MRYAMNGLFGIGIGALLAFKTGDPKTFYYQGSCSRWRTGSRSSPPSWLGGRSSAGCGRW
jgi:hypothetical protein